MSMRCSDVEQCGRGGRVLCMELLRLADVIADAFTICLSDEASVLEVTGNHTGVDMRLAQNEALHLSAAVMQLPNS